MSLKTNLALVLIVFIFISTNSIAAEDNKKIHIMTVVIVQQDNFLQKLLQPFLSSHGLVAEYTMGHHSEVAQAAGRHEIDLAITHTKVREMQKLEKEGLLMPRQALFSNPTAFLGPAGDPAHIRGLTDPVAAVKNILDGGFCFIINTHERLEKLQDDLLPGNVSTRDCIIRDDGNINMTAIDVAFERNGYTMWGLHPYASKSENRLEPVVMADERLLQEMSGWVVKGSAVEKEASELLDYLASKEVKNRIRNFHLHNYGDIQAWWPASN